jgi:hypothetical protein
MGKILDSPKEEFKNLLDEFGFEYEETQGKRELESICKECGIETYKVKEIN